MVQLVVRWLLLDDSVWFVQIAMAQIGSVVVQFCFSWLWIDVTWFRVVSVQFFRLSALDI